MFEKNLKFINNNALKRRLEKISEYESRAGISYCMTPSNDYVLLKDNMPIDDLTNPREAIKKMFQTSVKSCMKQNDIIIAFGIGLGYLLDELYNTYSCRIMLYEPDLNLLHFVLHNVDISEILSSGRVYISNDIDEFVNALSSAYLTKDKVEIAYIPNYAIAKNKELLLLTQKVFDACKTKMIDVSTITKFSKCWFENTIGNLAWAKENETYILSDLENSCNGKTAIILGAGPSLEENIDKIKENRSKLTIFAVNKAAQYLYNHELTPDFIIHLDATNADKTLAELSSMLVDTNCIMDIRADNCLTKYKFKKIFYSFSNSDSIAENLAKYNKDIKIYEIGSSASTLALTAAVKMGFSKIILAGIDLAFKENEIYAGGETGNRISQDQIVIDNVTKKIVQVKSVKGGTVYSRDDYEAAISHFNAVVKNLKHDKIYNISSFGANLEGTINTKFEDIEIEGTRFADINVKTYKFAIENFLQDELFQINNIISVLSKSSHLPILISAILKSLFVYQSMQGDILEVLQKNFDLSLCDNFINTTKNTIKDIVNLLQSKKLI